MCLYPKLIRNRKYTLTKKNGGNIPPVKDKRVEQVPIGCGNCMECRKQKAREWQVRLLEDIKHNTNGKMITLTFNNESIKKLNDETIMRKDKLTKKKLEVPISALEGYDKDNAIATKAIYNFRNRWRKKHKKEPRHWLITELGHQGTENIHLHGIIWTNESYNEIESKWQYGYIWPRKIYQAKRGWVRLNSYVNGATINYHIKYVTKKDEKHQNYKSIILTSNGIGKNYNTKNNTFNGTKTNETYRTSTGHKIGLPVYWRNKAFTEEEREQLWLQKLDKEERWINGQRIDVSKGLDEYFNILEYQRIRNKKLGYGNDKKDWNREKYELEIRKLMHEKRLKNGP